MTSRGQAIGNGFDGFDKNVAGKMPKMRREEEPLSFPPEEETPQLGEVSQETKPPEREGEKKSVFIPPIKENQEEDLEVFKLIEDLHGQLLVSNRTKRALEMDLGSSQKALRQMTAENKSLGSQVEALKMELQSLREAQSELSYLEEENEDALQRIAALQEESRAEKELLIRITQERDEALNQIQTLKGQTEDNDLYRIKGRLKERELLHFLEENRDLSTQLEEALRQNEDLEQKYEGLKKSFNEVKESLTLLRDACKTDYYNLSENTE